MTRPSLPIAVSSAIPTWARESVRHAQYARTACDPARLRAPDNALEEDLAASIGEIVVGEPALTEKKMLGGIAFLIGGNLQPASNA